MRSKRGHSRNVTASPLIVSDPVSTRKSLAGCRHLFVLLCIGLAQTGATPLSARMLTMRVFGDVLPFCSLGFGGGLVAPNHAESRVQHDRGVSALDSRTGHSQRGGSRLPPLLCCQRGLRFFVGIQY
jgi:hypothetical protein